MKSKKIKIAVLGTGSIGQRHLSVLNSLGVKSIAIPIRKERREQLKQQGFEVADDLEGAKRNGAVGVIISTDTSRHISDCVQAINLDFCVLCEKPLSSSAKEAEKIREKMNNNLYVAYNLRFDEGFQKLFQLAQDLKGIYYIFSECRSYLPDWRKNRSYLESYSARKGEGGVILDLSHEIDYLNFFYDKPKKISGITKNFGILGIQEEEFASAIFDYNISVASVTLDYVSKNATRRCLILGKEGEIEYNFLSKQINMKKNGKEKKFKINCQPNSLYLKEMKEFLRILFGKERKYLCSFKEALDDLIVADAWKASSVKGKMEALIFRK
ncbi:MAG: Gfo/Idh/MocA family oxidoreductase [Acidobacteria bacterium]|nr:Gfo/Idh/MocA family oxidoreductase [Acidobacteriota bacterium]